MIGKYAELIKSKTNIKPESILEIGSRDGNDANFLKKEFGVESSRVYIVEPNPSQVKKIKIDYPDYNLFDVAVYNKSEKLDFYEVYDEGMDPIGISSLLDRNDDWYSRFKTRKITVNSITGKDLLNKIQIPIDICKIDVEGASYEVIESFGNSIHKIKSFHIETEHHAFWKNQKLHSDVCDLMKSLGYEVLWSDNGNPQTDTIWIKPEYLKTQTIQDLEIHMLICKKDFAMGFNCLKSLFKYKEFKNVPVYFHEDGSLCEKDFEVFKGIISDYKVISKKDADELIKSFLENYPFCKQYRFGKRLDVCLWHKIKTFDYFLLSKTKNILCLDTDLLFLRKPTEVLELVAERAPFYFPDVQNSYSFNEPKDEIPVLPNVNTGLFYIPGNEYYNIESIEKALSNLIKDEINYFPAWIEQSAFAHMFYINGKYKRLNSTKNRIPFFQDVNKDLVECLHFVSYPPVRSLYKNYLNLVENEQSGLVFDKTYRVLFNEKEIELALSVSKSEKFLYFEYAWGLEKANIPALSHCFKILKDSKEEIFEFGSSETGFFFVENNFSDLQVYHTYDWYGEKKWSQLEIKL